MIKYLFIFLFSIFSFGQNSLDEIEKFILEKDYNKSEDYLVEILINDSYNSEALELLGDVYSYQDKWDYAITQFEILVERDNLNATYQYKLGEALGRKALQINTVSALFLLDDVKEAFIKTLELDKNHIDAHWALVVYYTELPGILGGSIKKALKYSEELKTISLVDYYLSKGYVYEYDDEYELAEENYLKAVEVGGSLTCFQKLSDLYETEGEYQKAINTIEKANNKLQINSLNYQLGKVSAAYNLELEKGEKCLIKYINNYKQDDGITLEWPYYRLAQIYRLKNDKASALKWIEKSLKFKPEFESAQEEKELILKM